MRINETPGDRDAHREKALKRPAASAKAACAIVAPAVTNAIFAATRQAYPKVCRSTLLNSNPEGNPMYVRKLFCLFLLGGTRDGLGRPDWGRPADRHQRAQAHRGFLGNPGTRASRSVALFTEAAPSDWKARACMNCHPVSRQPTQGDDPSPPRFRSCVRGRMIMAPPGFAVQVVPR